MRRLEGQAIIGDENRECTVSVLFDLDQGRCLISTGSANSGESALSLWLAAMGQVFLRNVVVGIGGTELVSEKLGPFMLTSCTQVGEGRDERITSSSVAAILGIDAHSIQVNEIELKPLNSGLTFNVTRPTCDSGSEILFHGAPKGSIDCTVNLAPGCIRVHTFRSGTSLAEYIRCFSPNLDLSKRLDGLRVALSLFLRRRVFQSVVRNKSEISINLAPPDHVLSYGILVENPKNYREVLEILANHTPVSQNHFLIESFSNPGTLEVRLLNAFVYMECIDGGRTLSANRLASVLGISVENADALVYMRNIMIHDGLGVRDSLAETRRRLRQRRGGKNSAKVVEQAFKTNSPHGYFYAALMDAFSKHLASYAGFSPNWVRRTVALSF